MASPDRNEKSINLSHLSRRQVLRLLAGAAGGGILAACGSTPEQSNQAPDRTPNAPEKASTQAPAITNASRYEDAVMATVDAEKAAQTAAPASLQRRTPTTGPAAQNTPDARPTTTPQLEQPNTFRENRSILTNEEKERAFQEFKEGYTNYKKLFVTSKGAGDKDQYLRARMPEPYLNPELTSLDRSTSESMGFLMIFAAMAEDKETFVKAWQYSQSHFIQGLGLMHWNISVDGTHLKDEQDEEVKARGGTEPYYVPVDEITKEGEGAASDGDIDMALALIIAAQNFGDSYTVTTDSGESETRFFSHDALTLLENIMKYEVDQDTMTIKLGNNWGGRDRTSADRFDIPAFEIFAKYTEDERWLRVAESCQQIIKSYMERYPNAALLPNFFNAQGNPVGTLLELPPEAPQPEYDSSKNDDRHGYDATRIMRLARKITYQSDDIIAGFLERMNNFYKTKVLDLEVWDAYTVEGEIPANMTRNQDVWPGNLAHTMGAYVAAMIDQDKDRREKVHDKIHSLAQQDTLYFSQSVYLYSLLDLSEHMLNPYQLTLRSLAPSTAQRRVS